MNNSLVKKMFEFIDLCLRLRIPMWFCHQLCFDLGEDKENEEVNKRPLPSDSSEDDVDAVKKARIDSQESNILHFFKLCIFY